MENSRITFIGCGNMGRSLIGGLIANGLPENFITGTDIDAEQRQKTASQYNIEVLEDNQQAVKDADVVVLAVKPQSIEDTLKLIKEPLSLENPLLISIAAGIKLSHLGLWAGEGLAIIRVMPNTPALIQAGATALEWPRLLLPYHGSHGKSRITTWITTGAGTHTHPANGIWCGQDGTGKFTRCRVASYTGDLSRWHDRTGSESINGWWDRRFIP
jgi:hypothetical protein